MAFTKGNESMSVTKRIRMKNGKRKTLYRAQVYVGGLRVADQTFDTLSAAHAWHDKEKEKKINGIADSAHLSNALTFDECLDRYMKERFPMLERSTQESLMVRLVYMRDCPLTPIKMNNLKSHIVDSWMHWLLKHKTAKCPKRKSFIPDLKALNAILTWYRNYLDADFIVPITQRHRDMARYRKMKSRRPDYYAKPDEVRAWVEWLKNHRNPVYYQLAAFMMLTGVRVGEACGLYWEEIDLDARVARIVRVVSWEQKTKKPRIEERAKNDGSIRLIMLPELLVSLLKEMKSNSTGAGLVFRSLTGTMIRYNAIQSAFNAGFEALDLPWRSTHICRHTYATMAVLATRDIGAVQASLGHKSRDQTEKYAKNIALLESGVAEKTAKLLDINIK